MGTVSTSPEATAARAEQRRRERGERVAIGVGNPAAFGEIYVRPYDAGWTGPLPNVALEILGFLCSTQRGVVMTPPEFLKTTMVSQLYPLFLTARYAAAGKLGSLAGMLFSEFSNLAEKNLGVIAWHIENNALLARDFVDTHGRRLIEPDPDERKWTDSKLIVRRAGVSKDPTWEAKGLNSGEIQGARLRHLLGDDVVTPGSARSPSKQRHARTIWDTQMVPRVLEDGQAILAGNFNHPRDLTSELAGRGAYSTLRRPTLHVPGDRSTAPLDPRDETAVEQLPERWSRRRVLAELSAAPHSFPAVHLLRSATEGGTALRADWMTIITRADIPRKRRIVFGIDPAPGAEVDPDPSFFSITVAALSAKHLDVIESVALRIETTEQVELLGRYFARYGPIAGIGIAKIALDRYYSGAMLVGHPQLRPWLGTGKGHSIPGDKTTRLTALGAYAKSGWLRVVDTAWKAQTADPEDRDQEESLFEQWVNLPQQNHDDRLDSLDLAVREASSLLGGGVARTVHSAVPSGSEVSGPIPAAELDATDVMTREW